MARQLIVYLSDTWPQTPQAPWVLLDDNGHRLDSGHTEVRHWPAADTCQAVLGGAQCVCLQLALPRAPRREEDKLLRYVLAERLLGEVDQQHLSVIARQRTDSGQTLSLAVVTRLRVRTLVAQFSALGRPLDKLVAALDTPSNDGCRLDIAADGSLLLHHPGESLACDPGWLTEALRQVLPTDDKVSPPKLTIRHFPEEDPTIGRQEARAAGWLTTHDIEWPWWQEAQAAHNLLHGEFAPRQHNGTLTGRLRLPLWLVALSGIVWLAGTGGELLWQRWQLADTRQRTEQVFRLALPGLPAISPEAQLIKQLDRQRERHGELRSDDFLALLASWLQAVGTNAEDAIETLRYADGQLTLTLRRPPPAGWQAALAVHGLSGQTDTAQANTIHLQARMPP